MSDSDVASLIGSQKNWVFPKGTIDLTMPEPLYSSGTQAQINETTSFCLPFVQWIFDLKSGLQICVLNVPKDPKALDETEGVLIHLAQQLEEQNLEPADLVRRAWKSGEHNDTQSSV